MFRGSICVSIENYLKGLSFQQPEGEVRSGGWDCIGE